MDVCAKGEAAQVFHPAANIFPIDDDSIPTLADDIKANGQKVAIEMMDGQVLDGRRRWLACKIAGVKPITRVVDVDDPIAYVLSLNLHRRHLTPSQLSMVADKAREIYDRQAKERMSAGGGDKKSGVENLPHPIQDTGKSRDKAGKAVGVSGKSVDMARTVRTKGVPELAKAVEEGRMAVSTAAILAHEPEEVQRQELANPKRNRRYGPGGGGSIPTAEPDPQEPEEDSQETPQRKRVAVGVIVANEAIDVLKRIPRKDPLRLRGFQIVSDWIKVNSK